MTLPEHTAIRIIDANVNRAREALRVMEEYARFGLEDSGLTSAIKETRHALAKAVSELVGSGAFDAQCDSARAKARRSSINHNEGSLIAHRDSIGDIGRDIATPEEFERSDAAHVAKAGGKRLGEALRAIEEYGKTLDPAFAVRVERIRYRGYGLEQRLSLTIRARERFSHVRLYVLLTESLCSGDWFATAQAALKGGADCLQLRERELTDRELLRRAKKLAQLCRDRGALFVVNDRPDLAVLSGADGVHLGQDDVSVPEARRILPSTALVGVSTHSREQFIAAAQQTPDYIAVGPMFPTPTKPHEHVAGPQTLAAARRSSSLPLVAVGGVNELNAREVLSAARCCLCVCGAIISQVDVAAAAMRIRAILDRAAVESPGPDDSRNTPDK